MKSLLRRESESLIIMGSISFEKFMTWVQTLEDPGERFAFEGLIGEGNSSMVHKAIDPGKESSYEELSSGIFGFMGKHF